MAAPMTKDDQVREVAIQAIEEFYAQHGHTKLPFKHPHADFASNVRRRLREQGQPFLSEDHMQRLNKINFFHLQDETINYTPSPKIQRFVELKSKNTALNPVEQKELHKITRELQWKYHQGLLDKAASYLEREGVSLWPQPQR